ncbi:MAG: hypothetical protein GXC75_12850 [Xanthomonadaceae bacterium]|nr:hypothetical protein [Xanthomonadaceae bacterium]
MSIFSFRTVPMTASSTSYLTGPLAPVDPSDATWFPFDVDLTGNRMQWLRCDEALIQASVFLDPRMPAEGRPQALTPLAPVADLPRSPNAPAWLWHTSFCGSTLLARLLHLAPYSVALREPLVLRRLGDAADAGLDVALWLRPITDLLARPWHPDGHVIVKPTHAVLNIARPAMAAHPESRGIVLTSGLEDFVVSHLKKTSDTLANVPVLAARALRAGTLAQRLSPEALNPPSVLAAAALQWAAQRDVVAALREEVGERVRLLDWTIIRHDMEEAAVATSTFLQLPLPDEALRTQTRRLAATHSKASTRPYDIRVRDQEHRLLRTTYAQEVSQALHWAERHVLPALPAQALSIGF